MAQLRKVAIVTSRLPRLVSPTEPWMSGLRAVLCRIKNEGDQLVVSDGTARADLIRYGANRIGIPLETIDLPADCSQSSDVPPQRDRVLFETADLIYVLSLRTGGNIQQLLVDRALMRPDSVVLIDLPGLQTPIARQELCEMGVGTWQPSVDLTNPWESDCTYFKGLADPIARPARQVYSIVPFPDAQHWDFLTHTTRACSGAWPDESFEAHAAGLFESRPDSDHSPLGTLRRIVCQKRLIAAGKTIRGSHDVVSFTCCPLEQIPALHRFRPHRVRWDFEPYGLCLRRDWLLRNGARPVMYGDDSDWKLLPEGDRPYFQVALGESGLDWSIEQEWRHLGDLSLTELSPDDVLLFVPNFEAARSLAEVTEWPITLWPGD